MTWEYKGVKIWINGSGEFRAELDNDVRLETKTLAEMRQMIDTELKNIKKRKLSLKVIGITRKKHSDDLSLAATTLVGVNRTGRDYMFDPPVDFYEDDIYPDTPTNRSLVEAIIKTETALGVLKDKAKAVEITEIGGYGRIDTGKYESVLRALEAKYAKALALSKK